MYNRAGAVAERVAGLLAAAHLVVAGDVGDEHPNK